MGELELSLSALLLAGLARSRVL